MKKITGLLAVFLMLFAVSGTVQALDFTDHVKVAPNGEGDLLIYPVYAAANGGWESKVWVQNTATDRSVVAKIVFLSMVNTEETLDFLIYLSPTDVWNGLIRVGETGAVEVYSTDDSALSAPGVWASAANPLRATLATPSCVDPTDPTYDYVDTNAIGYIEVIMSAHSTAAGQGDPDGTGPLPAVSLNQPPVPKSAIYNAYWGGNTGQPEADLNDLNMVTDGINVLAGHMEFRNLSINQNSVVPATVLRDYDGTLRGEALTPQTLTTLGEDRANNSLGEVEAALSKDFVAMPFSSSGSTIHFLTFPTKLTNVPPATVAFRCSTARTTPSPYFDQRSANMTVSGADRMSVAVSNTDFDLSENSAHTTGIFSPAPAANRLSAEVNFITGFAYNEGWAQYDIQSEVIEFDTQDDDDGLFDDGDFNGVPVIGAVISLDGNGYWANGSAWRDGRVRDIRTTIGTPYTYYYYQYWDSSNQGIGATKDANDQFIYDADAPSLAILPFDEDQTRVDGTGAAPNAADHPVRP